MKDFLKMCIRDRYADVLTLTAEAIVRNKNAVTQEAVDLLNEVRTRSLPGLSLIHIYVFIFQSVIIINFSYPQFLVCGRIYHK